MPVCMWCNITRVKAVRLVCAIGMKLIPIGMPYGIFNWIEEADQVLEGLLRVFGDDGPWQW